MTKGSGNDREGQQQHGKNYTLMLLLLVWRISTRGCGEFPVGGRKYLPHHKDRFPLLRE